MQYYNILPYKVYNSVGFSIFTVLYKPMLCNHRPFGHPKKKPCTL